MPPLVSPLDEALVHGGGRALYVVPVRFEPVFYGAATGGGAELFLDKGRLPAAALVKLLLLPGPFTVVPAARQKAV